MSLLTDSCRGAILSPVSYSKLRERRYYESSQRDARREPHRSAWARGNR